MTNENEQLEATEKLRELLRDFDDAMLVSTDLSGQPHARPMRIAACDHKHLDDVWFVTSLDSGKIEEIRHEPRVAVTMADKSRFLSISGYARVVTDPGRIADLWRDSWKLWFPDGPTDSEIALIQVRPLHAEYWDQSFPRGVRFAIEAAKAWLKNEEIEEPKGPEHHGSVSYV